MQYLAGLLDFIPYLGPFMAGVPAALIDSWAVEIAPALIIVMQLVFGTIFGCW